LFLFALAVPAGTGSHAELVQCALLNQLVLPLLAAAHGAGRAGELLSTECMEVLSAVFRVSDTHSLLFGEWRLPPVFCFLLYLQLALRGLCACPSLRAVQHARRRCGHVDQLLDISTWFRCCTSQPLLPVTSKGDKSIWPITMCVL
jgi:hypothetical protein